jgi:soluble lytic murein transglycosylase-like protein
MAAAGRPTGPTPPGIAPGTENYAGAGGPMQFLAPTWARWGRGGDRWDAHDAIGAATRKLCADGVARGDVPAALWAYNPSRRYAARVLAETRRYQAGGGR